MSLVPKYGCEISVSGMSGNIHCQGKPRGKKCETCGHVEEITSCPLGHIGKLAFGCFTEG